VSRKWKNWCQNEVDEEKKGADSRDEMKHNEKSDLLFLERMMKVAEQIRCRGTNFRPSFKIACSFVQL